MAVTTITEEHLQQWIAKNPALAELNPQEAARQANRDRLQASMEESLKDIKGTSRKQLDATERPGPEAVPVGVMAPTQAMGGPSWFQRGFESEQQYRSTTAAMFTQLAKTQETTSKQVRELGGYFLASVARRTLGPAAGQVGYGAYAATQLAGRAALGGVISPLAAGAAGAAVMVPGLIKALAPETPQEQAQAMMRLQQPEVGPISYGGVQAGAGLAARAMFQAPTTAEYARRQGVGYGRAAAELEARQGVSGLVEIGQPLAQRGMGGIAGAIGVGQMMTQPGVDPLQQQQWGAALEQWLPLTRLGVPFQAILQGVESGDLPELTGRAGYDFQRILAGDPHIWSQMARAGAAPAFAELREEGGLPAGTAERRRLESERRTEQRGYQQWQFRFQAETLQRQRGYQTRVWGIEAEQREEQRGFQRVQFDWQRQDIQTRFTRGIERLNESFEDLAKQRQRGLRGYALQEQMLGMRFGQQMTQFGWQQQDISRQQQRAGVQLGWGREDIAFQGAQMGMQYGWGQEDIQEQMRYATGRQRRQLMRQQQRATISYGMGMGQLATQEERLEIRGGWTQEDLAIAKGRVEQRKQWAREVYELQMQMLRQRRGYSEEDYQTDLARLNTRRTWLEEDYVRDLERHGVTVDHFEVVTGLEDTLITTQQAYWTSESERATAALEKQVELNKLLVDNENKMITLNQAMEDRFAQWNEFWSSGGAFAGALQKILGWLKGYNHYKSH